MSARERLPVGQEHLLGGGKARTSRGPTMGARERLPVERGDVHACGVGRAH